MFLKLPVGMMFSLMIWAVLVFTIVSSFQLMLLERLIKKSAPQNATYSTMSPENKKNIHKLLIKIGIGLSALIVLVVLDKI